MAIHENHNLLHIVSEVIGQNKWVKISLVFFGTRNAMRNKVKCLITSNLLSTQLAG